MDDSFDFCFDSDAFLLEGLKIDIQESNDSTNSMIEYPGLIFFGHDRGVDKDGKELGHAILGTIRLHNQAAIELARSGLKLIDKAITLDEELMAKTI